MSPRDTARQPPGCRTGASKPGPGCPRAGLTLASLWTPRAFRDLDEARSQANGFAGHHDRGACAGLSAFARPEHPSARRTTTGPVRTFGLLRRSTSRLVTPFGVPWSQRQDASKPLLQPTSRVTSTRDETPPSETARRVPWENPPALDFEDAPWTAAFPPFRPWDGAGPPRGHPASNGLVLDDTMPASGRPAAHARAETRVGVSSVALSADGGSAESNPLAPLVGGGEGTRERPLPVA